MFLSARRVYCDVQNNLYELIAYVGNDTKIVLPSRINGHTYEIHKYAFYHCNHLTSITIPSGVTGIGERAFALCTNLNRVSIGADICYIGENAFSGCTVLQSADFAVTEGWQLLHSGSVEKRYDSAQMADDALAVTALQDLNRIYNSMRRKENG